MDRRDLLLSSLGLAMASAGCASSQRIWQGAGAPNSDEFERAFYFAFPLYEFARVQQERSGAIGGVPGRLNSIVHRGQLLGHSDRLVTAPNNDTIYSSAFLELSGGPVQIEAPSSTDRYFSIAFMQAFTDVFAYIGSRATGGQGGTYWIVGPGDHSPIPPGTKVIRSPTNDVWMLMRTLVDGVEDLPAARAFQTGLTITVPAERPPARGYSVAADDVTDPIKFLALVNEVIARNPGRSGLFERASAFVTRHPGRSGLFDRASAFSALGIGSSAVPSASTLERWRSAIPDGLGTLRETFRFRDFAVQGWSYQPPGVGSFGNNDLLRAAVALGGIAALTEEEAMYFHANFDIAGEPLTGTQKYRWRVPPGGVPVDGFWSLSMYEVTPEGRYFFTENPIGRYSIGDRTPGLFVNPDGSVEILIQRERPTGDLAANWLPAPEGRMRLALRAYLPREQLRDRSWRVPPMRRIDSGGQG
jgi:hypothetical protein